MNIDNILIPTDFSESADNALSIAAELAHMADARLYLMHSVQRTYSYDSERLAERIKSTDRLDDLVTETILEFGDPAASILTQIEETEADLVVMGSTGRSETRKKLFGSVSMEMVSNSPVPVLLIPEEYGYRRFENIVFLTDFHTGDLNVLNHFVNFAGLFDAELHILHVVTSSGREHEFKSNEFKDRVSDRVEYDRLEFEQVVGESFYDGLVNYINEHDAGLLTVTRYKKTFLQNLVEKDHTRQVGYNTGIPLLILIGEEELVL